MFWVLATEMKQLCLWTEREMGELFLFYTLYYPLREIRVLKLDAVDWIDRPALENAKHDTPISQSRFRCDSPMSVWRAVSTHREVR